MECSNTLKNVESVKIISRSSLKCLTEMNVEGTDTFLGEVRHFKANEDLNRLMPKELSIAWTQMPYERELPAHYHPCQSLIVIANGEGVSTGDTEASIKFGDIVHIPEWNLHGFKGTGKKGFSALSIQFQKDAIFSSEEKPETSYFDRESIPLEKRMLTIVSRDSLETINSVTVNNEKRDLGILKNFSSSKIIKNKLPSFFSAAWVNLDNTQTLDNHIHSCDSMIIVTEGSGILTGDLNERIEEGDIVFVPAGRVHGFKGSGDRGFWALSIQFQEVSLYENSLQPQVEFVKSKQLNEYDKLLIENEKKVNEFLKNKIFCKEVEDFMKNNQKVGLLKDCLQVMSNSFQRLMFSRMALSSRESYRKIFFEHLLEELGHDTELKKERNKEEVVWDPILEASTSWFFGKNFLIDDPERIVMIQMVLEKGASLFYGHFSKVLENIMPSEHIKNHSHLDEGHDELGVSLLKVESEAKIQSLNKLLDESWSMLNLYLDRVATIIINH